MIACSTSGATGNRPLAAPVLRRSVCWSINGPLARRRGKIVARRLRIRENGASSDREELRRPAKRHRRDHVLAGSGVEVRYFLFRQPDEAPKGHGIGAA